MQTPGSEIELIDVAFVENEGRAQDEVGPLYLDFAQPAGMK